jgi:aryl-phospho-beta-D-glucosidase BglC (GH1 family)
MKNKRFLYIAVILALLVVPLASMVAQAQTTLPTASQVASQITVGWNIGNTLEAICGENAWGNPNVTQQLINSVKAAGFNAVRIPVAWDCHSTNNTIDPAWMARVKQVVDYAISQNMYVIINIHWDNGWLENHVTFADQQAVNVKQNAYWTQIANTFKTYNEHLLFAGTNEVHQDYNEPTSEYITVQQSYLQTFVNAVRATGGNNASRTLVVQTYNTNAWHGLHYFSMPTDSIANRLMVEIHHYDPYDYTLNASGPCLAWGAPYTQYSQCAWAQEAYVDDLFNQVKNKWVAVGIPVIIGEYTVSVRPNLDLASRQYYLKYINQAAKNNGIKTFFWDTGDAAGLFNRNTGAITDQGTLNAIMQGAGVGGPNPTPTRTNTPPPGFTPTRTNTPPPGFTPTRTFTPTVGPSLTPTRTFTPTTTGGGGTCTPTSTVTAPFTWDGAGVFCWQIATVPSYVNNWNNISVTINGTNFTNVYVATGGLPAKINNNYYISYNSNVAWGHLEVR